MKPSLAIALGVKNRKSYAKGGMIKDEDSGIPMKGIEAMGDDYEPMIEDDLAGESMEDEMPKAKMPRMMLACGGMAQKIMAKRMAKGGMVQGDNMPVEDDDGFSAETSNEGPLGEGMDESDREDKIMVRKSMLDRIMSKLHADNKGA